MIQIHASHEHIPLRVQVQVHTEYTIRQIQLEGKLRLSRLNLN